jgi:hypothetical protein
LIFVRIGTGELIRVLSVPSIDDIATSEVGSFYANTRCHLLDTRLLEQASESQSPQGSQLAKEKKNGELGALCGLAVVQPPQVGSGYAPCARWSPQ